MDEIEWMKYLKKCFSYITTFFLVITVVGLIYDLKTYIYNQEVGNLVNNLIGRLVMLLCINIFFGILYGIVWIIYKYIHVKININFDREYIRELTNTNPPAITSLIYDLKTEVYKDYTATILELYIKKYINISGFNEEILIHKGPNEDLSKLLEHEKYVYNCIIHKERFDENIFKKCVVEDAQEKDLIIESKVKNYKLEFFCGIGGLTLATSIILLSISKNAILSIFAIILLCISIGFIGVIPFIHYNLVNLDNKYKITKKGKEELKKIKAFKNFIKDYTLVEEKDIEYVQILEEYIPYSLSLGMSPQVEKYIKENEIYRNLIYKERNQQI